MKMYKIYRLVKDGVVCYIGRTTVPLMKRFYKGYLYVPNWKDCKIELIEETTDLGRERFWIEYYRNQGVEIYNRYKGDTGLSRKDAKALYHNENRDKMLDSMKQYTIENLERLKEYRYHYHRQPHRLEKNRERNRLYRLRKKQEKLNQST